MKFSLIKRVMIIIGMSVSTIIFTGFSQQAQPIKVCAENNPYHIIANKNQALPEGYKPINLVIPNIQFSFDGVHEKKYMEQGAASALEELFEGAKKEDVHLVAISGYRSYERQKELYNSYVRREGRAAADTFSARPGHSEHQTGYTMDISARSNHNQLTESFSYTKEGKWLADHAHEYGFIIRYPKGKEEITGYIYEPWHVRYVGQELAAYIHEHDLTLEEVGDCDLTEALELDSLEIEKRVKSIKDPSKTSLEKLKEKLSLVVYIFKDRKI